MAKPTEPNDQAQPTEEPTTEKLTLPMTLQTGDDEEDKQRLKTLKGLKDLSSKEPKPPKPKAAKAEEDEATEDEAPTKAKEPDPPGEKGDDSPERRPRKELLEAHRTQRRREAEGRRILDEAKAEAERLIAEAKKAFQPATEKPKSEDFATRFAKDPVGTIKALGYTPMEVAKFLAESEMGPEKQSAETRIFRRQSERDTATAKRLEELEAWKREREEEDKRQLAAKKEAQVLEYLAEEASEFLANVPDDLPFLQREAKERPQRAKERIVREIVRHARENPRDVILDAAEAAELVEDLLADELSIWVGKDAKPTRPPNGTKTPTDRRPDPSDEPVSSNDLAGRADPNELPEDEDQRRAEVERRLKSGAYLKEL